MTFNQAVAIHYKLIIYINISGHQILVIMFHRQVLKLLDGLETGRVRSKVSTSRRTKFMFAMLGEIARGECVRVYNKAEFAHEKAMACKMFDLRVANSTWTHRHLRIGTCESKPYATL